MAEADQHLQLVRKAILSGTTGCFFWESDRRERRVNEDSGLNGIQAAEIKRLTIQHLEQGGKITVRTERDEEWMGRREFDCWYSVCFEVPGEPFKIFVKMVLNDDDEDMPEVVIVGAHRSSS